MTLHAKAGSTPARLKSRANVGARDVQGARVTRIGERLRARIRAEGPLPFAAWMEACLYDPTEGFYAQGRHPAGTQEGTHFATSPTLHPFFAQCIARDLADAWRRAGSPAEWIVVEFGAGTGALARDATAALHATSVPVHWIAVDVTEGPAIPGVEWMAAAPERIDAAVANEFLDAVPFDLHQWDRGEWRRLGVGLDEAGAFTWRTLGPSRPALPAGTQGQRRVVMPGMPVWLAALARAGARTVLLADYGGEAPARDARAFRAHGLADALDEPGTVDLTADVDFAALRAQGAALGFSQASLETQEEFLLRHGVLDALNAIPRNTPEGASAYLRLRQLLLPTGLGAAFKVVRLERPA